MATFKDSHLLVTNHELLRLIRTSFQNAEEQKNGYQILDAIDHLISYFRMKKDAISQRWDDEKQFYQLCQNIICGPKDTNDFTKLTEMYLNVIDQAKAKDDEDIRAAMQTYITESYLVIEKNLRHHITESNRHIRKLKSLAEYVTTDPSDNNAQVIDEALQIISLELHPAGKKISD